jgi:hypothetical protein
MRRHLLPLVAATAFVLASVNAPAFAQAIPPAAQSSVASGVTVKVTPRDVAPAAETWAIDVVFDTHTQELSDDLLKTTVLVTDDGRELKPSAWKGAAPGGHHREGTLEFTAPQPAPKAFELRMQRPGETQARVFRFGS